MVKLEQKLCCEMTKQGTTVGVLHVDFVLVLVTPCDYVCIQEASHVKTY